MVTETKQEISVETKPAEVQKTAADMWMRPYQEFERFFNRVVGRDWAQPFKWDAPAWAGFKWDTPAWGDLMQLPQATVPSVDVIDRDDHVLVRAEIPGINKDDLNVAVSDNVLTIKGESRHEEKKEDGDYFKREISRTSFSRSIALPAAVDASKVSATLANGVLEVKLGKAEESKRRSVKVQ